MADKDTVKRDAAGRITSASTEDFIRMLTPPKSRSEGVPAPIPSSTPATDMAKREAMENKNFEAISKVRPEQKYAKGGSASSRADGCAQRGKTKGTMVMCGGGKA
jgi:hypothetical protein